MAERKRAVKQRRRERKNVPQGHVHIQATFNNTIITITDLNGAVISWGSAGTAEFGQLCPPGSEPNAYFRQCASYWDMAGSFVNAGVLNPDLFFANTREILFIW